MLVNGQTSLTLEEKIQKELDYYGIKREWLTEEEYQMLKEEVSLPEDVVILDGFSAIIPEIIYRKHE